MTLFYDPVIAEDGYTYERRCIAAHFEIKLTSPMTNERIGTILTSNLILKQIIQNVLDNNSNLQKEFEESKKEYSHRFGKELFDACKCGDINAAQMLLENGAEVNWVKYSGSFMTPLWIACSKDHIALMMLLLEKGADVRGNVNRKYGTPESELLWIACCNNSNDAVRLLLDKGADVNFICDNMYSIHSLEVNLTCMEKCVPLFLACIRSNFEITQMLLEKGVDVNSVNHIGETCLHMTCKCGSLNIVKLLLNNGADINHEDNNGVSPLYIACEENNIDLAQLLLDNGSMINNREIRIAYEKCHTNIVKLLKSKLSEKN